MPRATITKTVSTRGSITLREGVKGFLVAVATTAAANLYAICVAGQLPTVDQVKAAAATGLAMGGAYVFNKFRQGPTSTSVAKKRTR